MTASGLAIDLATTPNAREFRDELRGWLTDNLDDRHRTVGLQDPTGASGEDFERRRSWQQVLHSGGWAGVHWPAEYGGRGASLREYAIYLTECAAAGAPDPVNVIGLGMVGPTLIAHGTVDQQAHLGAILAAEDIWCQLFSEPDAGSDLGAIKTRAKPVREGGWSVTGQKIWTSWGLHADWGLLLARTGDPGFGGLSCFLVPMTADGVTVRGIRQISGDTHFCEVFLDDVYLPADALVGELNAGWPVASNTLVHERTTAILPRYPSTLTAAAELLGLAARDGVSARLRDEALRCWSEAQLMRLSGYRGVELAERGQPASPPAMIQRLQWGLLNRRIFEVGTEIVGSNDGLLENRWTEMLLVSRGWTIGGGTSQIQRNMLAEKVLGLPRR